MKKSPNQQILRINYSSFPSSFNPHLSADIGTITICKALFEGLTRIDAQGKVQLGIAEQIELSPCKKKYTFTLRPSKWSNGENLSSFHFVKSWIKALLPKSFCPKSFFLIKNAKPFYDGMVSSKELGIYAPSEKILVVELEHPAPYFLKLLADPIYSPLYQPDSDGEPIVFNGPFLIENYLINTQIHLSKNPLYWDTKSVTLKKIEINLVKHSETAVSIYEKNLSDWVGTPFIHISDEIAQHFSNIKSQEASSPFWLFCNIENPKLKSSNLRKALSYAIDRKEIIKYVLPNQNPLCTILPKDLSSLTSSHSLKHDEKKAKELFKLGLEESHLNKVDFKLTLNHSNIPEQEKLALYLKHQWENVLDIKIILKKEDWNSFYSNIKSGNYEIGGFYLFNPYNDPSYFLEYFEYHHNNHARWEHKIYQKHLALAKQSKDEQQRKQHLKQAELILTKELPVIPIYNYTHLYLCKNNLKNFFPSKFNCVDFKWVYFND